MSQRSTPPFRADHVGSLLRPAELHEARARLKAGEIDGGALREVEDRCIRNVVAMQEGLGLKAITDGEFRRDFWHLDFLAGFDGIELADNTFGASFNTDAEQPPMTRIDSRIAHGHPIMVDHFAYLDSAAHETAKFCIPGPAMVHFRGGRDSISRDVYPDMETFWADLGAAYRGEIADLAAAGCGYLQIDDVSFAYLCDPKLRDMAAARGDDPDELVHIYGRALNDAIAGRPDGMTVALHMCRGNYKSSWMAEGGYEAIAETLFQTVDVDGFFMEYDTDRAGGFAPLRFVPDGRVIVLGLISTKTQELEAKDAVMRRVDEAAQYVPLDNLCLSPQCGFSSTHHGNLITEDDQQRKLALVVEIADEVWG